MSSSHPGSVAAPVEGTTARGTVVLALPLPERRPLGEALRAGGFQVIEQTMDELGALCSTPPAGEAAATAEDDARIAEAWVVDVEAPGAAELVRALRHGPEPAGEQHAGLPCPVVVAVGRADGAPVELGAPDLVFDRPLDLEEVTRGLVQAAGDGAMGPSEAPADPADAKEPRSIPAPGYDASLADDFPAIAGLPGVESMIPELGMGGDVGIADGARLSKDIEELLTTSVERARSAKASLTPRQPDDAPTLVPPELLASLDELLLGDDEGSGTGASLSQLAATPSAPEPSAEGSQTGNLQTAARSAPAWHTAPGTSPGPAEAPAPPAAGDGTGAPRDRPSTMPPQPASRSSTGSMVRTEQHRASSAPPAVPPEAPTGPPPLPLGDGLPIPTPTIGTVQGRPPPPRGEAPAGQIGSPPPASRLPFPSPVPLGSGSWDVPPSGRADGPTGRASGGAGPSDPPRTVHDSWASRDAAPTLPPATGMPSLTPTPWDRPSSMPPPGTWAEAAVESPPPPAQGDEPDEPLRALARAIGTRTSGAVEIAAGQRVRWLVLQDGDVVTAVSQVPSEGLLPFLIERGALSTDVAERYASRLPHSGRHAAAALIAHGLLGQDELWPVLRAHAEWLITRAISETSARCRVHEEAPERLRAEPNVFGGAAGVEVFIESVRRVLSPPRAVALLGGRSVRLGAGPQAALLAESALTPAQAESIRSAVGTTVGDILARQGDDFAPTLVALSMLQVVSTPTVSRPAPAAAAPDSFDPLDAEAVRERVRARMALVRESDYFALLGLTPDATEYEIRRAFVELRRTFEPSRLLTVATADLADDVQLILEVLEEAFQILRDPYRRERYRKAILETAR